MGDDVKSELVNHFKSQLEDLRSYVNLSLSIPDLESSKVFAEVHNLIKQKLEKFNTIMNPDEFAKEAREYLINQQTMLFTKQKEMSGLSNDFKLHLNKKIADLKTTLDRIKPG